MTVKWASNYAENEMAGYSDKEWALLKKLDRIGDELGIWKLKGDI